jgi:hypothetical protein
MRLRNRELLLKTRTIDDPNRRHMGGLGPGVLGALENVLACWACWACWGRADGRAGMLGVPGVLYGRDQHARLGVLICRAGPIYSCWEW